MDRRAREDLRRHPGRYDRRADGLTGLAFDAPELATLMAALQHYQDDGCGDPENRTDAVHEYAAPGHVMSSLDAAGISELQERIMRATGEKLCQCDNCQFVCPESWLIEDIKDLDQRLDYPIGHPKCIEPAGECPVCQALSYTEDTERRDGSKREVKP